MPEHEHNWNVEHCIEKMPGYSYGNTVKFRHCVDNCDAVQEFTSVPLEYEESFGGIVDKGIGLIDAYLNIHSNDDDGYDASLRGWIDIDADRFAKLKDIRLKDIEEAKQKKATYYTNKIEAAIKLLKYEGIIPLDEGEKKEDFQYIAGTF